MKWTRLSPEFGLEASGIDLSGDLSKHLGDQFYDKLIEGKVIFFRGQKIDPQKHIDLACLFGTLSGPHPVYPGVPGFEQILELRNDAENPPDTDGWHADLTYTSRPPVASVLVARELPSSGGDTLWTDMYSVFETLDQGMKEDLRSMFAVHDLGDFRNSFVDPEGNEAGLQEAVSKIGCAVHKVVKKHPATGKEYLYVNEAFTAHVLGKTARESRRLLNFLYDHMLRPEFQIRWRWQTGDVAIWDNRCTQHYATADYLPEARLMNRITVISDARFPSSR